MQLPDGSDVLPHARPRLVHWAVTATALSAVVAAAAVLQPPGAAADPGPARQAEGADLSRVQFPMDCGPGAQAVDVFDSAVTDFDGDGRSETVALVRCDTPTGTPPNGIFVLTPSAEPDGAPRIVETLLSPDEGMITKDFSLGGQDDRTIAVTLLGYSSDTVPRCCPDQQRKVTWEWREGRFVLVPEPLARSV